MKRFISLILVLFLCLSLCACGNSAKEESYSTSEPAVAFAPALTGDYAANGADYGGFAAAEAALDMETTPKSEEQATGQTGEKIIYSANASVETLAFDDAIKGLEELVQQVNGFIESSSVSGANYDTIASGRRYTRSADYTIRVPSENFEKLMGSLSTLGNVPYSHVYTENVTSQYYDTQARLNNYQAQEHRLVELLDKAETVSDVIEIENELTEVRYRIESLQTSLKNWDRQVAYSTVSLSVNEVREYTPAEKVGFGKQLWNAVCSGFDALLDLILWIAEALPVLLVLGAAVFGLVKLVKKPRSGKPRKIKRKSKEVSCNENIEE